MDVYSIILTLMRSTMLIPDRYRVVWFLENDEEIEMDMKTYIIRSTTEQMLEDSVNKDEIYAALDRLGADKNEYPTGESYNGVRFH